MEQDSPAGAGSSRRRPLSLFASMRGKLLFWFALASLLPMAVLGYLAYGRSRTALANAASMKLALIRDIKRQEISDIVKNTEKSLTALARSVPSGAAALTAPGSPQALSAADWLAACADDLSFADLFLVSRDGTIVASARRGPELSDKLFEGPFRESGLSRAVRQALSSPEVAMVDMTPYAAAGNAPMAFLAMRLPGASGTRTVMAAALAASTFEDLVNDASGLEKSIKVNLLWPDKAVRGDARLDPEVVAKAMEGVQGSARIVLPGGREASVAYGAVSPRAGLRWGLVVSEDQEAIYAPARSLGEITLAMALVVTAVAIIFALGLAATLTRPLTRITLVAEKVAQGDLSVSARVHSRDEIGMLAAAFNQMMERVKKLLENERSQKDVLESTVAEYVRFVEKVGQGQLSTQVAVTSCGDELSTLGDHLNGMTRSLRELATELADATEDIAGACGNILSATSQQAATTSQQAAAVTQTTATVEEVRQTAQQAAERTRHVSQMVQEATQTAGQGLVAVEKTIEGMEAIREQVGAMAENILALSEKTQKIGEIISTVNDIADQSNLLALNAAIEAARAGEAGRGFAVVAGEVRNLAEQSQQATAQVREILTEIQKAAGSAVSVTEEGIRKVDAGANLTRSTGESIRAITERIEKAALAAQQIAISTKEQLVGMDQISAAMESINQAAGQSETVTHAVETAASNLDALSSRLKALVKRYDLS